LEDNKPVILEWSGSSPENPENIMIGLVEEDSKFSTIATHMIPEFPVNLMAITAIGLMGALVALRLKSNRIKIQ